MRGLIAKDICLIRKMSNKILWIMYAFSLVMVFLGKSEIYAFSASAFFSLFSGIHLVMTFTYDGLSKWKKYELILPVNVFQIVGAKYILIIYCVFQSILGTICFYGLHYLYSQTFSRELLEISVCIAGIVPILWCSICFSIAYWIGYMNVQYIRMIGILLIVIFLIVIVPTWK